MEKDSFCISECIKIITQKSIEKYPVNFIYTINEVEFSRVLETFMDQFSAILLYNGCLQGAFLKEK